MPQAIESVLAQTYPNIELVIVDDGSTDESLEVAEAYARRHPDVVRVFTHPGDENRGISATCNYAISKCRGDYWGGLPSDDLFLPEKIERQVALLEERPDTAFTWGQSQPIDDDGNAIGRHGLLGWDLPEGDRAVDALLRFNSIPGLTQLVRRSVLSELGYEVYPLELVAQDWYLSIRLAAQAPVVYMPEVVAKSRVHTTSTFWSAADDAAVRWRLQALERVKADAGEIGGALGNPRTLGFLCTEIALHRLGLGERGAARKAVREALGHLAGSSRSDTSTVLGHYCLTAEAAGERGALADVVLEELQDPAPRKITRRHARGLALARAALLDRHGGRPKHALRLALEAVATYPELLREPALRRHGMRALTSLLPRGMRETKAPDV